MINDEVIEYPTHNMSPINPADLKKIMWMQLRQVELAQQNFKQTLLKMEGNVSLTEQLERLISPTFYDLMSLFEVFNHPAYPDDYYSDRAEWHDVLNIRSRDDGGLAFAKSETPVIDVSSARMIDKCDFHLK